MQEYLIRTSHRPRPLPSGRWAMTQRWNDLLFAHWPVPATATASSFSVAAPEEAGNRDLQPRLDVFKH